MPGVIVGLVVGLMGLMWFMQKPPGDANQRIWREPSSTILRSEPVRSQVVVVDSVPTTPVVCKPVETDENKPIVRNLTGSFEQRRYILEPGEQCTPE